MFIFGWICLILTIMYISYTGIMLLLEAINVYWTYLHMVILTIIVIGVIGLTYLAWAISPITLVVF